MEKEEKDSSVGWTDSGKEEEWDSFDRRMIRRMRQKLDTFGERLWLGDVKSIEKFDKQALKDHIAAVYNALQVTKPKEAKELFVTGSNFFKKSWHITWLSRQANLIVDHVEDHA